jgi:hypothetical protein
LLRRIASQEAKQACSSACFVFISGYASLPCLLRLRRSEATKAFYRLRLAAFGMQRSKNALLCFLLRKPEAIKQKLGERSNKTKAWHRLRLAAFGMQRSKNAIACLA